MAKASIEYNLPLRRMDTSGVLFSKIDDCLNSHEWLITYGEWYQLGRPVDVTITVEVP